MSELRIKNRSESDLHSCEVTFWALFVTTSQLRRSLSLLFHNHNHNNLLAYIAQIINGLFKCALHLH